MPRMAKAQLSKWLVGVDGMDMDAAFFSSCPCQSKQWLFWQINRYGLLLIPEVTNIVFE